MSFVFERLFSINIAVDLLLMMNNNLLSCLF